MVLRLIESMTMVTIVTTKIEERGEVVLCPLVSRFAFASWSSVISQFPIFDHQGCGFSQPLIARYAVMFPTSYVMLLCFPNLMLSRALNVWALAPVSRKR